MSRPADPAASAATASALLRFNCLLAPGRPGLLVLVIARGQLYFLPRQLPSVLIEVNVVAAPLQFAALKIYIVRAHGLLGRSERLAVSAVGRQAIPIQPAEIKVPDLALLFRRQQVGIAHV